MLEVSLKQGQLPWPEGRDLVFSPVWPQASYCSSRCLFYPLVAWGWVSRWYSSFSWKGLRNNLKENSGKHWEGSIQGGRLTGKYLWNESKHQPFPVTGQGQCCIHSTCIKFVIIKVIDTMNGACVMSWATALSLSRHYFICSSAHPWREVLLKSPFYRRGKLRPCV